LENYYTLDIITSNNIGEFMGEPKPLPPTAKPLEQSSSHLKSLYEFEGDIQAKVASGELIETPLPGGGTRIVANPNYVPGQTSSSTPVNRSIV
jgi:hypothetical protein